MGAGEPEPKWRTSHPQLTSLYIPDRDHPVNRPLDREQIPEYRLTISVKDNPENPR